MLIRANQSTGRKSRLTVTLPTTNLIQTGLGSHPHATARDWKLTALVKEQHRDDRHLKSDHF